MRGGWKKASCAIMLALLPCAGFAADGAISFNKAPAEVIVEVTDGIVDETLAQAIVEYREKNGPFKTAEDLRGVPGMTSVIFGMLLAVFFLGEKFSAVKLLAVVLVATGIFFMH